MTRWNTRAAGIRKGSRRKETNMAKKPKAIELVFKAQPAMALLLEVMKEQRHCKLVNDIENWLTNARELLKRKEKEA